MKNTITYDQRFSVDFNYPVCFTENVFSPDALLLADTIDRYKENRIHKVAVYVDENVLRAHPLLDQNIREYFQSHADKLQLADGPVQIPGGEQAKQGWDRVKNIMSSLGNRHLCRQSFVLVIGGGSVLDMVGFAVSLVHRGLRLIRMPTTVLAQNDAGVGVKNAMNEHGMKNFVGTFAPPFAVINDYTFLTTLEDRDWTGGIAEAFKVAIIKDREFFDFLCTNADKLRNRVMSAMKELIRRCAELHLDHIRTNGDPFEFGAARPLDFGHWSAHRLESMSGYRLGHGQAVSIGIALDAYYAMKTGFITELDLNRILNAMTRCGLPVWDHLLEYTENGNLTILKGLDEFREHLGGLLTITLPQGIGAKQEIHEMDRSIIADAVTFLRDISIAAS